MANIIVLLLLLAFSSISNAGFQCPKNIPCKCSPPSGTSKQYQIYCPTEVHKRPGFYMTLTPPYLNIECQNSPEWSDFLPGSHLDMDQVFSLTFSNCDLPNVGYNYKLLEQLKGISRIKILKVTRSRDRIKKHQIDIFPNVETLVLSNNFLGNVPDDFLHGFPNLTSLYLRNTRLQIPARFFEKAVHLRYLDVGQNSWSPLDLWPGIFVNLKNAKLLNLTRNNFTHFEPKVFRGLTSLEFLDISNVNLETLSSGILDDLVNLSFINASANIHLRVREGAFIHNKQLKQVYLENSGVQTLPPRCFADLPNLMNVVLQGNSLTTLRDDVFSGSHNITELILRNNSIATLPPFLLQGARSLRLLDLSSNNLSDLPDIFFADTSSMFKLNLAKNRFTTFPKAFASLGSLEVLNLEENQLLSISPEACYSLPHLRIVRLAHNHLNFHDSQSVHHYSPFHHCISLNELDLSYNTISEIYSDWTFEIGNLYKLNLSHNHIDYIEVDDLQFMTHELFVDLSHNMISIVNISLIEDRLPADQTHNRNIFINLNANPIECYCEIFSFLRYIYGKMESEVYKYIKVQHDNVTCSDPPQYKGMYLTQLLDKELECNRANRRAERCVAGGVCDCLAAAGRETYTIDCAGKNLTDPPVWINNWDTQNGVFVTMDLRGNRLTQLPNMTNVGYDKIHSLDLADNQIASIDDHLSLLLPTTLKNIHLEFNKLRAIGVMAMGNLTEYLESLWLQGNPWQCDNTTQRFRDYVQNYKLSVIKDYENVFCYGTRTKLWTPTDLSWILKFFMILGLIVAILTFCGLIYSIYMYCSIRFSTFVERYWEA